MTTEAIVFLVTAVILPMAVTEFGDWCPTLAKRLVRWTARQLGDPQATERYSEEWTAELEHLPGKLWHMRVALGYFAALPRLRWSLRATRGEAPSGPTFDELVPTRSPIFEGYDSARGLMHRRPFQAAATRIVLEAILDESLSNRNRLHVLTGPPGCGKTMTLRWIHEDFSRTGKKVRYVWAPHWAHEFHPLYVSAQLRDRLAQAAGEVDLLVVEEADATTREVLEALRLPCPVLMLTREPATSNGLTRHPSHRGVVVDMDPGYVMGGYPRSGPGNPGPLPPVTGQP
ncbi:hypothetical protein [Streptomyces chryseus]